MRHHDEAISRFVTRTGRRPQVLGLALTGSLARGRERADSDIDLVLVVDEATWKAAVRAERIMYVETEDAGYEHGYFDIKLATTEQLAAAAERGDDAVRDSLATAKVLIDKGIDLDGLLRRAGRVPEERWRELAASQLAQARLHGAYFLEQGLDHGDPLLTAHAAVHLAVAAARTVLALGHVRHPGPKQLLDRIRALPEAPDGFADALSLLVEAPSTQHATAVLGAVETAAKDLLPAGATLSRFVLDNELAWFTRDLPPEYR